MGKIAAHVWGCWFAAAPKLQPLVNTTSVPGFQSLFQQTRRMSIMVLFLGWLLLGSDTIRVTTVFWCEVLVPGPLLFGSNHCTRASITVSLKRRLVFDTLLKAHQDLRTQHCPQGATLAEKQLGSKQNLIKTTNFISNTHRSTNLRQKSKDYFQG